MVARQISILQSLEAANVLIIPKLECFPLSKNKNLPFYFTDHNYNIVLTLTLRGFDDGCLFQS